MKTRQSRLTDWTPDHIIIFDGTSHWITSGDDFEAMHGNEVVASSSDLDEIEALCDELNENL